MRAEREKLNAKITAGALKLSGGRLELPAEMCHIVLFSGGSCTVQCGDMSLLVSPLFWQLLFQHHIYHLRFLCFSV